jgi:hypothetical protein
MLINGYNIQVSMDAYSFISFLGENEIDELSPYERVYLENVYNCIVSRKHIEKMESNNQEYFRDLREQLIYEYSVFTQ